jgi:hypothetical protein
MGTLSDRGGVGSSGRLHGRRHGLGHGRVWQLQGRSHHHGVLLFAEFLRDSAEPVQRTGRLREPLKEVLLAHLGDNLAALYTLVANSGREGRVEGLREASSRGHREHLTVRSQARGRQTSFLGRLPSNASTSEPEARAQCGSSARWDPCGGRPESVSTTTKGRPYRDR